MPYPSQIGVTRSVTLHSAVASLPAPGPLSGGSLATLTVGRETPDHGNVRALPETALLYITADDTPEVVIPGPVTGYAMANGVWFPIGYLAQQAPFDGSLIKVTGSTGYVDRVALGGDWERLALVAAGAFTGATVTVTLKAEVRF